MKEELDSWFRFCSLEENADLYVYKEALILSLLKTHPTHFDTLKTSPVQFPNKSNQSFFEK